MPPEQPPNDETTTKQNSPSKRRNLVIDRAIFTMLTLVCCGGALWLGANVGWEWAIAFMLLGIVIIGYFAFTSSGKLGLLMFQMQHLTPRNDIPRRVELFQAALELVERDTQPEKCLPFSDKGRACRQS